MRLGKAVLAYFGEVHPKVLRRLDDRAPSAAFEVFLDQVPQPKQKGGKARPSLNISAFQPVHRDFAFVVDASVSADQILRAASRNRHTAATNSNKTSSRSHCLFALQVPAAR